MPEDYIFAIDQGTSGTKAVIFDSRGQIVVKAGAELQSVYPQVGFVEQSPEEIYQNVLNAARLCVQKFAEKVTRDLSQIKCCGISNQRETLILWDQNGRPLYNAIVWLCKRSVYICERLQKSGMENEINKRTGLIFDPYFSGTKVMWLYENNQLLRETIQKGEALFGTVDSWLLYKLTKGKSYYTDFTNASRTLFFNINELAWDPYLLSFFGLENLNLPEPRPSSFNYGEADFEGLFPKPIPVTGMIGDSHAAAFGEGCFFPGSAKVTMGTGSSILMNTGPKIINSQNGMVSTICWSIQDRTDYALEGIIVSCGATIKWLRDQLGLIENAGETEKMAAAVESNNGVYLVPAFSGLGAPHWKMDAKAVITGLTFGCDKNHIVRAALESIPYQIKDVITAMEKDSGIKLAELMADGGITANRFVMSFLADLLDTNVKNIGMEEVSALGAAYMAGLGAGIYKSIAELEGINSDKTCYSPGENRSSVQTDYSGWLKMIRSIG